jgi:lactate permease
MYALLAFSPMLFIIIAMVFFNKPSKIVIPIAWVFTIAIAYFVWKINFLDIFAYSLAGFFKSFEVIFIIFGAILLLNTMKLSGGLYTINSMFANISNDKRVQLLIIGWLFESFMEAVAGFGTPAALAAPLLITLGFPPFFAAFAALIFNTIPVSFGAVGAPIVATINALTTNLDAMADKSAFITSFVDKIALLHLIAGVAIPSIVIFIMIFFFGKKGSNKLKSFIQIVPFILYSGFIYLIISFIVAKFSYELPSLIASALSLSIVIFSTQKFKLFVPKTPWNFMPEQEWKQEWKSSQSVKQLEMKNKNISTILALSPYLIIGAILLITRIEFFHLKNIINNSYLPLSFVFSLFGSNIHYDFPYAYNPGILPFMLVAILIIWLHKMPLKDGLSAWLTTAKQMKTSAITLFAVFAMIQIMLYSKTNGAGLDGMLTEIAKYIAQVTGNYFILASPIIGILGTFLGGSAAVSNILFASLQFETASFTGLPTDLIIALQVIGSSLGNMVSINKIIAVCVTAGLVGVEGKIIRINAIPALIYVIIMLLACYLIIM